MTQIETGASPTDHESSFNSYHIIVYKKIRMIQVKSDPSDQQFELAFEFLRGEKINSMLLATLTDHHLFSSHGKCTFGARYRCRDRKCRAYVIYDEKTKKCFRLSSAPSHTHGKCDSDIEVDYWNLVALNEMRDRCSNSEILDKIWTIYTSVKQM